MISTLLRAAVRLVGGLLGVATARTETEVARLAAPRAAKRGRRAVPLKDDCILREQLAAAGEQVTREKGWK